LRIISQDFPQQAACRAILNDEQEEIASKPMSILRKKGFNVKTELTPASKFWPAELHRQGYYKKNRKTPYCISTGRCSKLDLRYSPLSGFEVRKTQSSA
jgi:peptide methionine sulfoxide reductase MsrA